MSDALNPVVDRLWSQMKYAFEVGGGHAGHLKNAWHTAQKLSQDMQRQKGTIDELNAIQVELRRELAQYKEREKTMGWSQV